jgi:hypothetical protein
MTTWQTIFENLLIPEEKLLLFIGDLNFQINFVPSVNPMANYSLKKDVSILSISHSYQGGIALTTHRLIAALVEAQGWKILHIPAINNLSERPLRSDKQDWPYQAIVIIPGGVGLILQTQSTDPQICRDLSTLLVEALMRLGVNREKDDSYTPIMVEERRRQEDRSSSSSYKKDEK